MTRSPRTPLLAAVLAGLTLAAPAAAHAADAFVGVTDGNQLVHFSSDTIPGLSVPQSIDGLPGGERIVALDQSSSGELIALGRSGTLYDVGVGGNRVKVLRTAGGFGLPIPPESSATLSVAPDGKSARVIAAGRDRTVDLTSGAVTADAPAAANVAADLGADGVLRGVDPASNSIVTLDATGEHTVASLGATQTHSPIAATTAPDGALWITTALSPRLNPPKQSRLLRFDPKTGQLHPIDFYLFAQLDALAAVRTVPDDTKAPTVSIHIPRQSLKSALRRHGYLADVTTSEPGQTVMSARVGSSYRAFGFGTAIHGGKLRVLASSKLSRIRATAGHRVRLHIAVHDWAGNIKILDRYFTLAR
ncbi:MAG TPA: hypothetical protein VGO10_06515 [Baekduia sp.]|jgi:hypothetical protein|nr:hypothetical protein [Baekduia sp.]